MKTKIHNYISIKGDLGCGEDIDKSIVIVQIVEKYKNIATKMEESAEYLNYINNDLVKFIGYRCDLKENGDIEGVELWDEIDEMLNDNGVVSQQVRVEKLLMEVPIYFLLSFLGYAAYREHLTEPI